MSRGFMPRHAWDAVLEVREGRVHLRRVSPSARKWKTPSDEKWSLTYDMARVTLWLLENDGVPVEEFNDEHWGIIERELKLSRWNVSRVPLEWYERKNLIAQRKIKEAFYQEGDVQDSVPELHDKMHEYQRDGVAFALALKEMGRKGCLIADEMGLGKTLQALAVCKYLMEETKTPLRVCVISPGYLRANWATEINKWGILRPDVDRAETMIKLTDRPSGIQNQESSSIVLASYRWMRENKDCLAGYDLVVFDECHLLKNGYHTRDRDCSLRYLAARELVPTVGFVLMLTGTPTPNAPKELFSLLHLTGSLGDMKWAEYAFRYSKRYFSTMFFGWNDDGTSAEQELQQLQEFSCIRRLAKDYLSGLPDEMRSFVTLPLHTGKAKLNKLAKERTALLNKLQNGALTDNERSKHSRQLQFNRTAALVASARAKNRSYKQYFRQYVQDNPFEGGAPPFIVFAYHEETILALQGIFEELGVEFGTVYGKTNKQQACETISLFQQGQVSVLILSLAMSAGLNLQRASTAFFAEVTWSPGVLAQAEKRIHRQGSEHARVHYVYLFGEKPAICADVYKKTRDKENKIRKSVRDEGAARRGASKKRRV